MSSSSLEAWGFAVVLGAIALAAIASLLRRPRPPRSDRPDGEDEGKR